MPAESGLSFCIFVPNLEPKNISRRSINLRSGKIPQRYKHHPRIQDGVKSARDRPPYQYTRTPPNTGPKDPCCTGVYSMSTKRITPPSKYKRHPICMPPVKHTHRRQSQHSKRHYVDVTKLIKHSAKDSDRT